MKKLQYWLLAAIILIGVGTIWDFQISQWQATVNQNIIIHFYYRFFEIFGEFSKQLVVATGFGFFANFGFRKKSFTGYTQMVIASIGLFYYSIEQFLETAKYLFPEGGNSHGPIPPSIHTLCIILGIITAIIIFNLMFKIEDENYKHFRNVAIVCIVYVLLLNEVITFLKHTWARPRFWTVTAGNASFIPWYVINGEHIEQVNNAYMSFPSGHTANAFVSLGLSLWFINKRDLLFNIFMGWGLLTAISRIFAGQHYLTDTLIGGLISVCLFLILFKLFNLEKSYQHIKNKVSTNN